MKQDRAHTDPAAWNRTGAAQESFATTNTVKPKSQIRTTIEHKDVGLVLDRHDSATKEETPDVMISELWGLFLPARFVVALQWRHIRICLHHPAPFTITKFVRVLL